MAKSYKWKKKYSIAEIRNASFDPNSRLFLVILYGWDGSNWVALRVNASGEIVVNT